MRSLATTLAGLAFLWAWGATVYLLAGSTSRRVTTEVMLSAAGSGAGGLVPPSSPATRVWMAAVLGLVALACAVPIGVALRHPAALRTTAWIVAVPVVVVALLGGFTVGLFYLPAAALLVAAGWVAGSPSS